MNCIAKFISLALIFNLASCGENRKDISNKSEAENQHTKPKTLNNTKVPGKVLVLEDQKEIREKIEDDLKGNLFGKFFDNRAEFFIVENPENTVHGARVKSIVLYSLDGQLNKIEYFLENDIADKLILKYGNFSIKGLDQQSIDVIKLKQIVKKTDEGATLNKALASYELKWKFDNKQIKYRVITRNKEIQYKYSERLKKFDTNYREIKASAGF